MAALTHTDSRRKYSWWWDSHIPKNSKWLQENLNDMDFKVKAMIKLIEEDADSFARRAEMYYKKRPELMKLVEEFYRAYRALAERYDQSTGALRQAHRTMAEAFPNQVPFILPDDSPSSSSITETEPHTPEITRPMRASLDPDDLHHDALGLSSSQFNAVNRNGAHSDESDNFINKRGLKQLNEFFGSGDGAQHHAQFAEGRVRKGLNFHQDDGKDSELQTEIRDLKSKIDAESVRAGKAEDEVRTLKETLENLEAEKEASLLKYRQNLERLANVETEVSRAQEDSRGLDERARRAETEVQRLQKALAELEAEKDAGDNQYRLTLERLSTLETELSHVQEGARELNEQASNAETEVQNLKNSLTVLEAEKEAGLLQYQQCLEKISNLLSRVSRAEEDAGGLNERANKAETEAQSLKQSLVRLEAEKEACLVQYNQCLETISTLESKLSHAENNALILNERAEKAESEVQSLNHAISTLNDEKRDVDSRYQNCLERISQLETEISSAQKETERLNHELAMAVRKLNDSEKQYLLLEKENHSLQAEFATLVQQTEMQRRELTGKQEELQRLQSRAQEESIRAIQAEAALQALQNLHSQSLEAQRTLTMELQKGFLMLKDMEHWSKSVEDELQQVKEENKNLNEQNLSSSISISNLQEEIYRLKAMTGKLEEEVGLRLDERNALQQEIYCLKEEIKDLNRRHQGVIKQVESVGLSTESLGSSVKELQDQNSKLKDIHQKESDEKVALLKKLEDMDKILEKNAVLEISLSDLNAELEAIREKVKALEESCESFQGENSTLVAEKASLVSQLEIAMKNMEKLAEKNILLENSLYDTNVELESLRAKSKSLQSSCQVLDSERSGLVSERDTLISNLKCFQQRLEELEKRYTALEAKCSVLEKEKEATIHQVEELRFSLDTEKQEYAKFSQSSEIRLERLEDQVSVLQEEGRWKVKEFEEEQERAIKSQVEIFILQKCIRDMEEKNFMLLIECEKNFEESKFSEKLIVELEHEYHEQQLEVKSLLNQLQNLRLGIHDVLNSVKALPNYKRQDKIEEDRLLLQCILKKIEDTESSLWRTQDEKQQMLFENLVYVTLLGQMRIEISDLALERNTLEQESKMRLEEILILQSDKQELLDMNGQLRSEVGAADKREDILKGELENLHMKFSNLQEAYTLAQKENIKLSEANSSLTKEFSVLEEEKCMLQEENNLVLGEAIALNNLSLIFKTFGAEKTLELKGLMEDMNHLQLINDGFQKEILEMEGKFETVERENLHLKESVEFLGSELNTTRNVNDQLNHKIIIGKEVQIQREMELSEVVEKLNATEKENMELHRNAEELQSKYKGVKITKEGLQKQVLELSADTTHQQEEILVLKEANVKFTSELAKLQEEIRDRKIREEKLSSELLEKRHDVELHEEATVTFYSDLQYSNICAAVFRERLYELLEACASLEDESASKWAEIEQLKQRLAVMESENGGLKSNFAAYLPIIVSLKDSLSSLEDHLLLRTKVLVADNEEKEDAGRLSQLDEDNQEPSEVDPDPVVGNGISDLHGLQTMVAAVGKAVIEMERVALQESLVANIKLEAAMKEIERLKSTSGSIRKEDVQTGRYIVMELEEEEKLGDKSGNPKQQKDEQKSSQVRDGIVMKDILLDQVSECSSYEIGSRALAKSRRENGVSDEQMLKLWETGERSGSRGHRIHKAENVVPAPLEEDDTDQIETVEELKSEYPSSELQAEKELGVDKLEISKRSSGTHQGNKRKVLERLASDAQKLTNIQITIEDLKKKMETTNRSKKTKGIDYDTLKGQLQEVEESIMQLVDTNIKLSTKAEESPSPDEEKAEIEETKKIRRRRVSEQARRGSEKIGRLQLEVQRIQFALVKLEEEHAVKGVDVNKRSTKIRLRDYLYISGKSGRKKKKGSCCACIRPTTPKSD